MINAKTKLVATIGPSSNNYETMKELVKAGLDLVRINMSHGDHQEQAGKIEIVERLRDEGYLIGVMLDLKGPKIRCGRFENEGVQFNKGDITRIVKDEVLGNKERFCVSYKNLYDDLSVGDRFTLDDGVLMFKVLKKEVNDVLVCEALNDHYLKDRKGLNAPYVKLMNEYLSEKDINDVDFACSKPINYIAASFVRRKEDVIEIRKLLAQRNREDIRIVAKIESPEAVENIDDILEVSNAVMIARGDLGVEVDLQMVPQIQKELVKKCNIAGKPVIVATHMLESMQTNPRPTRAEVSDVFNAVLDGADAIMLSGESASGKYPVESVRVQNDIAVKAEEILDYEKLANDFYESSNKSQGDAIGISVSKSVLMLDAKLVVIISSSFSAIRKLAKFKFKAPIIAITNNKEAAINLNGLYYGIEAHYHKRNIEEKETYALNFAKKHGVKKGENIIFVGVDEESKKVNMMKIMQVK